MTQHSEFRDRLDAFLDGDLGPDERDEVRGHLEGCEACRAELEALAALQAEARTLPREIAPPRDLWPEIAARLRERAGPASAETRVVEVDFRGASRRGGRPRWAALAAAAVVLMAFSSGITAYLLAGRESAPVAATLEGTAVPAPGATRPPTALAAFRPAEREYLGTVEALEAQLASRRGELAPETVAVIEENLQVIDRAIAEARAALESDPANADLPLMLSGVYRKKVELLTDAIRLPARSS